MKINKNNYETLPYLAGQLLLAIQENFDDNVNRTVFIDNKLVSTEIQLMEHKHDEDTVKYLINKGFFVDTRPSNTPPEKARSVLYTLSDAYFLTAVWLNLYESKVNIESDPTTESAVRIGKVLRILLDKYRAGANKLLLNYRSLDNSIRATYVARLPMVVTSLTDKHNKELDIYKAYKTVTDLIMIKNLGIAPIFQSGKRDE